MNYLAEQNVIGSLMMDADCISQITNELSADMFGSELLGRIYFEYQKAYDSHENLTLPQILQAITDYPQSVVMDEVKNCTMSTVTSAMVKEYASVVIKEYKAKQITELINNTKINPDKVYSQLGALITSLESMKDDRKGTSKTIAQIAKELKDTYFKDQAVDRINLGFSKLDECLRGLEGGDMIVIGARPGVGKSALVTQIATNISNQGKNVAFYNLEMQNKQMYERFVANQSGLGLRRLRLGIKLNESEQQRFDFANKKLVENDRITIYTGAKTVSEIRSEVRHMGYDIIIIDYMQLLKSDVTYRGNRYAEVGAISKAIKGLAMELNIPIIALSQLNRVSEQRETKEPTMAELREAGDIEQDASVILLLWNTDAKDRSKKCCKIEKQRQGETGKIDMVFNGDIMQFVEVGEWNDKPLDDCPFV